MEAFKIDVQLKAGTIEIFVVPFEIPGGEDIAGYLIVQDDLTLGSIKLGINSLWVTEDDLPWNDQELQVIGDEIACHFLLSLF